MHTLVTRKPRTHEKSRVRGSSVFIVPYLFWKRKGGQDEKEMVGHAEKPDDTGAKKCYNGGKQAGHNGTDSPEEGTERTDGMARL